MSLISITILFQIDLEEHYLHFYLMAGVKDVGVYYTKNNFWLFVDDKSLESYMSKTTLIAK